MDLFTGEISITIASTDKVFFDMRISSEKEQVAVQNLCMRVTGVIIGLRATESKYTTINQLMKVISRMVKNMEKAHSLGRLERFTMEIFIKATCMVEEN